MTDLRTLARHATITGIAPIEGADAIETATVGGWTVVVKKGEFTVGDPVLYFEIDAALPLDDPRFAFLEARGAKTLPDGTRVHRLKTARLRGVYSQGLVLPAADFPETHGHDGDLATLLGITKYEPPLPAGTNIVGEFPSHRVVKTDSERAQNLLDHWDELLAAGPWIATEKIDGTSLTVLADHDDLTVCSRNYQVGEGSLHWEAAHDTGLVDRVQPGEAIQAEVAGPGIQGNPLGLNHVTVVVFTFYRDGQQLPRGQWPAWVSDPADCPRVTAAGTYDLELPATPEEAVAVVDGIKSLLAPGRLTEGVVWHQADGRALPYLGHRATFKTISNRYLLKHDG